MAIWNCTLVNVNGLVTRMNKNILKHKGGFPKKRIWKAFCFFLSSLLLKDGRTYRVNIGAMTLKALNALAASHVPDEYHLVATTGDEGIAGFARCEVYRHDIAGVSVKILK